MKNLKIIMLFISLFLFTTVNASAFTLNDINVDSRFMSVVEINNDKLREHYKKNDNAQMFPASMTKVMTVYVAVKHLCDYDKQIIMTSEDFDGLFEKGASVVGFTAGEIVTVDDLLYGSLLSSGADATRALARIISGNEENYVKLMNQTAKEIGMKNSNFVNTSGLHDEKHYSTTSDLILLMGKALAIPKLKKMMSTMEYYVKPTNAQPDGLTLKNTLTAYSKISGVEVGLIVGGKTGWTRAAGYCLISYADFNDKTVIVASGDGFDYGVHLKDHNLIFEELFNKKHTFDVFQKGEVIGFIPINYTNDIKEYSLTIPETISAEVPRIVTKDDLNIEIIHPKKIDATVEANTLMGELYISYADEQLYQLDFINEETIVRSNFMYYSSLFLNWITTYFVYLLIIVVIVLAILAYLSKTRQ